MCVHIHIRNICRGKTEAAQMTKAIIDKYFNVCTYIINLSKVQ